VGRTVTPILSQRAREYKDKMMISGEYILRSEPIQANVDRETIEVEVANHGDRPIQVGSHMHFFEVNKALVFPRRLAFGMRLNIPAGTAVRLEASDRRRGPRRSVAGC